MNPTGALSPLVGKETGGASSKQVFAGSALMMLGTLIFVVAALQSIAPFISVDGYVYLAQNKGQWRYAAQSFPGIETPIKMTEVGIGKVDATVTIRRVTRATRLDKAKVKGLPSQTGVFVYGSKPTAPRPFGKTDPERCREWVREWMDDGRDLRGELKILSAYEGDLDGDGAKEQVAWWRIEYKGTKKPPISQALMLHAGGRTYLIYAWDGYECVYIVKAVADLDGDGTMELITKLQGWGYSRATLNKYHRGKFEQVPYKKLYDSHAVK